MGGGSYYRNVTGPKTLLDQFGTRTKRAIRSDTRTGAVNVNYSRYASSRYFSINSRNSCFHVIFVVLKGMRHKMFQSHSGVGNLGEKKKDTS